MTVNKQTSCRDEGFSLGVAVAVGFLVHGHGETTLARELLDVTNTTLRKAANAKAPEYDLSAIRKAMRNG